MVKPYSVTVNMREVRRLVGAERTAEELGEAERHEVPLNVI
jgi:hypothetical protein